MKNWVAIVLTCCMLGLILYVPAYWISGLYPHCDQKAGTKQLSQYPYLSEAYEAAAIQLLKKSPAETVDYHFMGFLEREGRPYMWVDCYAEAFCARIPMRLDQKIGIEKILGANGKSYHHAGLAGLKWHPEVEKGRETVVFESIEWIID